MLVDESAVSPASKALVLPTARDDLARAEVAAGRRKVRSRCTASLRPWLWKAACRYLTVKAQA